VLRYLVTGKGILTYSASLAAAPVKVLEESAPPDVQCSITLDSFKDGQIGAPGRPAFRAVPGVDDFPGITAGAWLMRPLSSGYVETGTPNPAEAPAINPRYPSDPTDRRAIVGSSASFTACSPHRRSPLLGAVRCPARAIRSTSVAQAG
jgi:choline dehydrogenase